MNWIKTGIFSLIGGFVIGFVVDFALLTIGDCGIGAAAKGIFFGIPIGNVMGIGLYRKLSLNSFAKADIAGGILALILSALATFAGLHAMDVIGGMPGFFLVVLGSCLGSLVGYALGLRIVGQHGQRQV